MKKKTIASVILLPFTVLTLYALWDVGYVGIFDYHRHSSAGWQVFTDLVIALILVLSFMLPELKRQGRALWPWILLTLTLGSFGPLIYLAFFRKPTENFVSQNA